MSFHEIDVCHYCKDDRTCRAEDNRSTAFAYEESCTVSLPASTPQDVKRVK